MGVGVVRPRVRYAHAACGSVRRPGRRRAKLAVRRPHQRTCGALLRRRRRERVAAVTAAVAAAAFAAARTAAAVAAAAFTASAVTTAAVAASCTAAAVPSATVATSRAAAAFAAAAVAAAVAASVAAAVATSLASADALLPELGAHVRRTPPGPRLAGQRSECPLCRPRVRRRVRRDAVPLQHGRLLPECDMGAGGGPLPAVRRTAVHAGRAARGEAHGLRLRRGVRVGVGVVQSWYRGARHVHGSVGVPRGRVRLGQQLLRPRQSGVGVRRGDDAARGALLRRRGERPAAVAAADTAAAEPAAEPGPPPSPPPPSPPPSPPPPSPPPPSSTAVTAALPTAAEPTAAVATSVAASDAAAALAAAAVSAALAAAGALLPELGAHVRSARLGVPARVWRLRELRRGDGRLLARRAARGRRGAVPRLRRPTVHALGAAGDEVQRLRLRL